MGSACLAAGACVGIGRFLQYQKRLLCYRYQFGGQNTTQMLSRCNQQCANNSVKCRGYSRLSQDQIEARDVVVSYLKTKYNISYGAYQQICSIISIFDINQPLFIPEFDEAIICHFGFYPEHF